MPLSYEEALNRIARKYRKNTELAEVIIIRSKDRIKEQAVVKDLYLRNT